MLHLFTKRDNSKDLKNAPRVSVLMPAYNAQDFIAQAIESILNQTFTDFEFIIINDGSNDTTADIIQSYAAHDKRIVFINNSENRGIIWCLNHGMDIARGQYIARMDADDISLPVRLVKQVDFMDKNPNCGVLGCGYRCFGVHQSIKIREPRVGIVDLLDGCKVGHPTVMIRREMFDKFNLRYNPDYVACEDYELWVRAVRYMDICNLPEILFHYRVHTESITFKSYKTQEHNTERIQNEIVKYLAWSSDKQKLLTEDFCHDPMLRKNKIKSGDAKSSDKEDK